MEFAGVYDIIGLSFGSATFGIIAKFHRSVTFRIPEQFRESGAIASIRVFASNGVIYQVVAIVSPTYWMETPHCSGFCPSGTLREIGVDPNGAGRKEE